MRGISLIEVVIAAALILALAVTFTGSYIYSQSSIEVAGQRMRANLLAEEGLEAARNIRDASFANLVNGTYGVTQSSGAWAFSGSSDTKDIFTRSVTISTIDTVTKQIASTVTWPENALRTGSTTLTTYLSNTQLLSPQSSRLVVNVSGAHLVALSNQVQGITLQNIGTLPITISKITVTWSTSILNHINAININGTNEWTSGGVGTPTGVQSSGTTLTLSPAYVLAGGTTVPINYFQFDGTMLLNIYTYTFTMSDGSTKTATTLQI